MIHPVAEHLLEVTAEVEGAAIYERLARGGASLSLPTIGVTVATHAWVYAAVVGGVAVTLVVVSVTLGARRRQRQQFVQQWLREANP
jgi:uncharacterized membrane protein